MAQTESEMRRLFAELEADDRIEVEHEVKVGQKVWHTTTEGRVVETARRRHSLHHDRNYDDKVWSDVVVLQRDDGELTTLTIDEFTRIRRIDESTSKGAERDGAGRAQESSG